MPKRPSRLAQVMIRTLTKTLAKTVVRLLTLLSLAAAVYAETITLGAAHFDLTGCVSPAGTYNCYQQAGSAQLGGGKACNSTSSDNGNCVIGVQAQCCIEVIGCKTEGCWNRVCILPSQHRRR